MLLKTKLLALSTLTAIAYLYLNNAPSPENPNIPKNYRLIFQDEFNAPPLNTDLWQLDTRPPTLQRPGEITYKTIHHTPEGYLKIQTADIDNRLHISRIQTPNKFEHAFGYWEARIKFQNTRGHHGSFWITSRCPRIPGNPQDSGVEVDIAEYFGPHRKDLGFQQNVYWLNQNNELAREGGPIPIIHAIQPDQELNTRFHVFGLLWTPSEYIFFIDGKETYRTSEGVSHKPAFPIFSQITADWEFPFLDRQSLPDGMTVDYVRVYDKSKQPITEFLLLTYIALSLSHLLTQIILAHLHKRKSHRPPDPQSPTTPSQITPTSISIIYPIYNEEPHILTKVFESATQCLDLPNCELIFIDDGSQNREELLPIYKRFESTRCRILLKQNQGKRLAQYDAFQIASGTILVTVDSDTIIEKHQLLNLIQPLLTDPAIGAATGDVRIFNSTVNLLTRMQSLRYWLAFHLERAAQSYAHCMLCCSGPFSAYKANLIKQIQDKYIHQTFLNHPCTYGDDRHLTNLVINHGYKTIFQPHAIAYTFAPTQFTQFIQQQVRWSKSFFRETVWTLKNYRQFSFYSLWDLVLQNLLTLTFIFTLSLTAFETLNTLSASPLLQLLITLLAMASLRALYALLNTRNLWFLIFPSYSFLHLTTLIPIRLKALFTLADSSWGTRSSSQKGPWIDHCKWIAIYLILILNITGLLVLTTENQILSNLTQTTFSLSQHFTFPIQTYPNLLLSIAALTSAVLVITHHQTTNPHTQPVQKRHE